MTELSGSVPSYYRDVFDVLCPTQNDQITQSVFAKVIAKSGLENTILSQIWDLLECKSGPVTRNTLYKALALVAFAQQGKTVSEKLFQNFSGQELPKPNLGSIEDLKLIVRVSKQTPTILSMKYTEFSALDSIQVNLVPEKKGIFLKHVEYEIISKRNQSTVKRRYNDFVAFHELLVHIYPFRVIPRLPPKKVMGSSDREFVESRRKALRRFLNIVGRHPTIYSSPILQFFLTYTGHEVVHKIKEQFRGALDEFSRSPVAAQAKDLVPPDTAVEFKSSKEQIKQLTVHVQKLRDMTHRIADRSKGNSIDMLGFGKELVSLGNDSAVASRWATGDDNVLSEMKQSFKNLSMEFSSIAEKHSLQGIREDEGVVDQLNLLHDLLIGYHELCERHEKGVLRDHHSALKKYGAMKTKRMAASVSSGEQGGMDKIESKIVQQESEIVNRENRNYFSLHCIHVETQFIYSNMQILAEVVATLVATQIKGHQEMCKLWEDLAPRVGSLLPTSDHRKNGSTSPHPPSSPR